MASLGEKLKEARLKQGLSLGEIAGKTRIQAHLLEAIESDDLQKIPGDFFRKSFVRQYAETLGLDPEEFETTTEVHFGSFGGETPALGETLSLPDPPDLPPLPTVGRRGSFPLRQVFLSLSLLVGVIAVCAVAYMSWEEFQSRERNAAPVADASNFEPRGVTPVEQAGQARPSQDIPAATEGDTAQPPLGTPAPSADARAAGDAASGDAPPSGAPAAAASKPPLESVAADKAVPSETVYGSGPREIRLSASALTWVRVREGEKIVYMGAIEAGQSRVVRVGESAQILTGNAGGLSVVWRGDDVGRIGPVGQVRTVLLTPEGASVQAPAPKPAPESPGAAESAPVAVTPAP